LIDTGCELNLLKESCIRGKLHRDKTQTHYLTGIGRGMLKTRGTVKLKINNKETEFHLVRKDFPIPPCGILGMKFLRENLATMTFSNERINLELQQPLNLVQNEIIKLPPRTRKLITLRVKILICKKDISKESMRDLASSSVRISLGKKTVR
jgi:hypothetical protein